MTENQAPEGADAALLTLLRAAFDEGFGSRETYNDVATNTAEDAWATANKGDWYGDRVRAALAAPPIPAPEFNSSPFAWARWSTAGLGPDIIVDSIRPDGEGWFSVHARFDDMPPLAAPAPQAAPVALTDEQEQMDAAKYRHWRDHAEVLCVALRYESPAWIDAYLAEALAERALGIPAPQAATAELPDINLCRLISAHEVYQYHPGALHEFAHEVIAEFCRVNGIPAPQTKEPTNDH